MQSSRVLGSSWTMHIILKVQGGSPALSKSHSKLVGSEMSQTNSFPYYEKEKGRLPSAINYVLRRIIKMTVLFPLRICTASDLTIINLSFY